VLFEGIDLLRIKVIGSLTEEQEMKFTVTLIPAGIVERGDNSSLFRVGTGFEKLEIVKIEV